MFDFSVSKHPHFDNACRQFALKHNLVELAANGDLDAIKLLNERMQDREELKLRKKLFGV